MAIPHEIALAGVYLPPSLIAGILGTAAAMYTTRCLDRFRLTRFFFYPPLVAIALIVLYTVLIDWAIVRL